MQELELLVELHIISQMIHHVLDSQEITFLIGLPRPVNYFLIIDSLGYFIKTNEVKLCGSA